MNKTYKYTLTSGEKKEVTFDVGVNRLAISNANGEDGAGNIDKMKDIELTDLQDKQILVYDSTSEKWKNENQLSAGDGLVIEDGTIQVNPYTYSTSPKKTAEKWIDESPIYAKVVPISALPNATTIQVAHDISDMAVMVNHFSTAKNNTSQIKFDKLIDDINDTNIIITASQDLSSYAGNVTIKYTKKAIYIPMIKDTNYAYSEYWTYVRSYKDGYMMYVDAGLYGSNHSLMVFDENISPAILYGFTGYSQTANMLGSVTYKEHTMWYTWVNIDRGGVVPVLTAHSNGTLAGYANPTLAIQSLIDEL